LELSDLLLGGDSSVENDSSTKSPGVALFPCFITALHPVLFQSFGKRSNAWALFLWCPGVRKQPSSGPLFRLRPFFAPSTPYPMSLRLDPLFVTYLRLDGRPSVYRRSTNAFPFSLGFSDRQFRGRQRGVSPLNTATRGSLVPPPPPPPHPGPRLLCSFFVCFLRQAPAVARRGYLFSLCS